MKAASGGAGGPSQKVQRRLRSLATLELINVPLQAAVWFAVIGLPTTLPNLTGFFLVAALLVVGGGYWLAKLHQLRSGRRELRGAQVFRAARIVSPFLLAFGVAVTGYAVATDPGRGSWPGLAFALFAVLEHVNYFHVQLMHDTAADLRRLWSVGCAPRTCPGT